MTCGLPVLRRPATKYQGLRSGPQGRQAKSVHTPAASVFTRQPFHLAFDGGRAFALAFLRRFLVILATPQFGQNPGLFAGALETPQGSIKILVFSYSNAGHQ